MRASNPCVIDVETSVIPDIAQYADDLSKPPSRMKDPEKIAAWIENAKDKQANFAALDLDLARSVCVCWTTDGKRVRGGLARTVEEEKELLAQVWKNTLNMTYVGHNILDFDLPLLVRRSLYLDVPCPHLELDRYRHPRVQDLQQILSWNGKINYRKLDFYCKRFGIQGPPDEITGADVPVLVARGTDEDWLRVRKHCVADVVKEWKLAVRIGVIELPEPTDPDVPF